jgi:hypothetical protein
MFRYSAAPEASAEFLKKALRSIAAIRSQRGIRRNLRNPSAPRGSSPGDAQTQPVEED